MSANHNRYAAFVRLLPAALLSACGGGGGAADVQPQASTGLLSLGVSDSPVHDATKVCIAFDWIEFKHGEETIRVELDPVERINLLDFQGSDAAPLLVNQELPAGNYQWMRLGVDAELGASGGAGDTGGSDCDGSGSYLLTEAGTAHNLYVPSGAQSGLKLVRGFTVPANGAASFTAEFDLMRSLVEPPGLAPDIKLKPTIRLVDNVEVGTLSGSVDPSLAGADDCEAAVYLFADGVTPNPIDTGETDDPDDPVATALVNAVDNGDGSVGYRYTIGFLLPGDYEAAFTCDGESFLPEAGKAVNVAAGERSTVDLP